MPQFIPFLSSVEEITVSTGLQLVVTEFSGFLAGQDCAMLFSIFYYSVGVLPLAHGEKSLGGRPCGIPRLLEGPLNPSEAV